MNEALEAVFALKDWYEKRTEELIDIKNADGKVFFENKDGDQVEIKEPRPKDVKVGVSIALEILGEFPVKISVDPKCPECLQRTPQDELDMFNGLCEDCNDEQNKND
jgi:hypothetical protein